VSSTLSTPAAQRTTEVDYAAPTVVQNGGSCQTPCNHPLADPLNLSSVVWVKLDAQVRAAALQNVYAVCRSKRLPAADQARVAYAAAALEEDANLAHYWLGDALAHLGDSDGAKEVFMKIAAKARNAREEREVAYTWKKAKSVLAAKQIRQPELTLEVLRQAGWDGVRHTISLVTPAKTGRKIACPRCAGQGEIPDFRHIAEGICFLCFGSRTIWEKATAL
jgi:hypothetical protein